jgi:hypothetical protein
MNLGICRLDATLSHLVINGYVLQNRDIIVTRKMDMCGTDKIGTRKCGTDPIET